MTRKGHADILVVSWTIPPLTSGSSRVLHNLLSEFGEEEVVLVGASLPPGAPQLDEPTAHHRVFIPAVPPTIRGERFLRFLGVPLAVTAGLWTIWRTAPRVLLVVFPDETYLLAGYLLHRLTGLPLTLYFHDLYLENARDRLFRRLAEWLQPRVLARAARFFVISEGMAAHYERTYPGLSPTVVPHSITSPIPDGVEVPAARTPFQIGYCGNIYENVMDELKTLRDVVEREGALRLLLFTPSTPAQLERWGLCGEHVTRDFRTSTRELHAGLAGCDALYLPLCFASKYLDPREAETGFPTKSLDYMVSGRPILVHCPAHYFLARFFRDSGAGLVVDSPEPAALRDGFARLQTDLPLRRRLVGRALDAARSFEVRRVAAELRRELSEVGGGK